MISRRNYLAITTMMLVICFLFLFPQVVKEARSPYSLNSYALPPDAPGEAQIWRQPELHTAAQLEQVESYVLFVGDPSQAAGYAVTAWAQFTKTPLLTVSDVLEFTALGAKLPSAAILEADCCDFEQDVRILRGWSKAGVSLIFNGLPEAELVNRYAQVRNLLGIREMVSDAVPLEAIHMYEGFLLGGERIYGQETEQDRQRMDLKLSAPWVHLQPGAEVYVTGMLSEQVLPQQQYRNEQLPPIIWRKTVDSANVFVANGDFLQGVTGIGVLSAIMAENSEYSLYPVVNSQLLTAANFPSMVEENREQLVSRYGKGQIAIVRDLLWPSMEAVTEINNFRMSSFFMPQYCYQDAQQPVDALVSFYLELLREQNAEAGISLQHDQSVSLADKWESDMGFLKRMVPTYQYSSAYLTEQELGEFRQNPSVYDSILTVCGNLGDSGPLFSYLDADTLCQAVTHDLLQFSFSDELALLSLETALGYSNAVIDMQRVLWPAPEEPGWEVYYERMGSNLGTYWKPFRYFDRLTISQSDARVRNFLCMDYTQKREADEISLEIQAPNAQVDFLLRTNLEEVTAVSGGQFQKIENGVWLIRCSEPHVEIHLQQEQKFLY